MPAASTNLWRMKMRLFKGIKMPSDVPMLYVGCHPLKWRKIMHPTMGFLPINDDLENLLDEAIGLYLEFKDTHGYLPKHARIAAVQEILVGLDALEDIALAEQEQRQEAGG